MKLLFDDKTGNCIGYDFTESETEAIKAGNTALVTEAANTFIAIQKEFTERWKNHNESVIKSKELELNAQLATNKQMMSFGCKLDAK